MSISQGSLKRVSGGGRATLPGQKSEKAQITTVFQQVPINQFEESQEVVVDKKLKKSIEKWTMLVPLIAYVDKSGKLILIDGHQRLAIGKSIGIETLPCQILQGITSEEASALSQELTAMVSQSESIHEEKFKVVSSSQTSLPDYLL